MDTSADATLRRVIEWAGDEMAVRRLVLVGSRARTPSPDDLADIDVQVYCAELARYTENLDWLSKIGEPIVCVRDRYTDGAVDVATRLVIFDGGVKVDFAFYPASAVSAGIANGLAYATLVDKDAAIGSRRSADVLSAAQRPSTSEFTRIVEEFWFEAYHVAKYLARGELLLAKSRQSATRQLLVTMIEWHERFARNRQLAPDSREKRASMSEDTWRALQHSFAGPEATETWEAMQKMLQLFRTVATETAAALRFDYPAALDQRLSRLLTAMASNAGFRSS